MTSLKENVSLFIQSEGNFYGESINYNCCLPVYIVCNSRMTLYEFISKTNFLNILQINTDLKYFYLVGNLKNLKFH